MSRYRGVDLDFGQYNRPQDRVEFDMMTSRGSGSRTITIFGVTFDPAAELAKRFAENAGKPLPEQVRLRSKEK